LSTHGQEKEKKRGGGVNFKTHKGKCSNKSLHPKSTLENGSFTEFLKIIKIIK
jgi:hypothetical protein